MGAMGGISLIWIVACSTPRLACNDGIGHRKIAMSGAG